MITEKQLVEWELLTKDDYIEPLVALDIIKELIDALRVAKKERAIPHVGEAVVVVSGVRDTDVDWPLEGWTGVVVSVDWFGDTPHVSVGFDDDCIPAEYIERCEKKGLDYSEYGFSPDQLERIMWND